MAAREVMDTIGVGQKYCNEIISKVHELSKGYKRVMIFLDSNHTGNNAG